MDDGVEFDLFYDEFLNELASVIRGFEDNQKKLISNLLALDLALEVNGLSSEMFYKNRDVFYNLLDQLKFYNEIDELELLENLNAQALIIIQLIHEDYFSTTSTTSDEIAHLDKTYNQLKAKLLGLKEEQEVISARNRSLLSNQNIALKIIEDLKNKNEAYSQVIDEDSNKRIKNLYDEIYDQEISIADRYRNWALIIFALIGGLLLLGFLNLSIQNWNHLRDSSYIQIPLGWESLLKTVMLFSLTTPAWYLTKESSMHRKVAYKAKMLGTELASFPLYAREFKDEERLELRRSLADRFFGQELYSDSKVETLSDNSVEQIKLLTEANRGLVESLKIKKVIEGS